MKIKYTNFRLLRSGFHDSPLVKDELIRKPKNLVVIEIFSFLLGFFITVICANFLFEYIYSAKAIEFSVLQLVVMLALVSGLITCYAAIQLSLEQAGFRKLFVMSAMAIISLTIFGYKELDHNKIGDYFIFFDVFLIFILSIIFLYPPNRKYYEWTKLHS